MHRIGDTLLLVLRRSLMNEFKEVRKCVCIYICVYMILYPCIYVCEYDAFQCLLKGFYVSYWDTLLLVLSRSLMNE